jgi:hypothetical protein
LRARGSGGQTDEQAQTRNQPSHPATPLDSIFSHDSCTMNVTVRESGRETSA